MAVTSADSSQSDQLDLNVVPGRSAVQRLRSILAPGTFGGGVFALAGGTASGQAIVLLGSPVVTRLYGPDEFGVLGVFVALLATIAVIASLRIELAVPLPASDEDAANLAAAAAVTLILMVTVVSVIVVLRGNAVANLTNTPALAQLLWLLPVGLLAVGIYQIVSYWAIRRRAYGMIARTHLYKGGSATITQVVAGAIVGGPIGLLVGDVVGRSAGTLTLVRGAWQADRKLLVCIRWKRMVVQASRYRRFPMISSGASLLNSAGLHAPALALAAFYGPSVAGLYAITQRVAGVPMRLIGQSVSQAYVGHGAKYVRLRDRHVARLFLMTAEKLFVVGVVPIAVLVWAGPWLFGVVFGPDWIEAGVYGRMLAGMFLIQFVASPLSQTLNMLERQGLQLAWDAGRLFGAVAAIGGAHVTGASARVAILGYGVTMAVAYLVLLFLAWRVLRAATSDWTTSNS